MTDNRAFEDDAGLRRCREPHRRELLGAAKGAAGIVARFREHAPARADLAVEVPAQRHGALLAQAPGASE